MRAGGGGGGAIMWLLKQWSYSKKYIQKLQISQ